MNDFFDAPLVPVAEVVKLLEILVLVRQRETAMTQHAAAREHDRAGQGREERLRQALALPLQGRTIGDQWATIGIHVGMHYHPPRRKAACHMI
jgi:hypothetical protein